MGSMETDGASTETENLTRREQRDTIEPRLNKNFQSERVQGKDAGGGGDDGSNE
jgi:hypothetical protein